MKFMINAFILSAVLLLNGNASGDSLGTLTPPDNLPFSSEVFGPDFADTYGFTLTEDSTVGISITNVFLNILGTSSNPIDRFAAELLSAASILSLDYSSSTLSVGIGSATVQLLTFAGFLPAGDYALRVSGSAPIAGSNYGGSFTIAALPVPVPAGIWLLGSGLLAAMRVRRQTA